MRGEQPSPMALHGQTTHGPALRAASLAGELGLPLLLGLAVFLLHLATNNQYGFHRDELQTLDDARHLDWSYVAYPPLTPFLGRISLELFGVTPRGVRVFPALVEAAALVLTAVIARELGGGRWAQLVAALAAAIAPVVLLSGALLQYVS